MRRIALAGIALLAAVGCAPLGPRDERAGRSSLGCMRAALASHDLAALPDDQAHCVAAGVIAARCSVGEAMLASLGKEIADAFGQGDAQWRDLQADRRGIACARATFPNGDMAALEQCCRAAVR